MYKCDRNHLNTVAANATTTLTKANCDPQSPTPAKAGPQGPKNTVAAGGGSRRETSRAPGMFSLLFLYFIYANDCLPLPEPTTTKQEPEGQRWPTIATQPAMFRFDIII
jgi:hypothetical protein